MRTRSLVFAALLALLLPAAACADVQHVVAPGETLTSIAATDGLTIGALAAANAIPDTSELIAGQIIEIPPLTAVSSARTASGSTTRSSGSTTSLSGSTTSLSGSTTSLSGSTTSASGSTTSATGSTTSVRRGSRTPHPTLERVDGAEIAAIARANAVPATLAEAIAWQESGWNNDERSVTGAVGVMQVAPATWRWINRYLTPADPLDGSSAADNIRAGVLLLHDLLNVTGGRQRLTIAAYFQGLASVQQNGQYASTRQYVRSVLAIERQLAA